MKVRPAVKWILSRRAKERLIASHFSEKQLVEARRRITRPGQPIEIPLEIEVESGVLFKRQIYPQLPGMVALAYRQWPFYNQLILRLDPNNGTGKGELRLVERIENDGRVAEEDLVEVFGDSYREYGPTPARKIFSFEDNGIYFRSHFTKGTIEDKIRMNISEPDKQVRLFELLKESRDPIKQSRYIEKISFAPPFDQKVPAHHISTIEEYGRNEGKETVGLAMASAIAYILRGSPEENQVKLENPFMIGQHFRLSGYRNQDVVAEARELLLELQQSIMRTASLVEADLDIY